MRRPGDGKRARFESHCCPQVTAFQKEISQPEKLVIVILQHHSQWLPREGTFTYNQEFIKTKSIEPHTLLSVTTAEKVM